MKNLLVLFFLITLSITSSAQFNVRAGVNLANQSIDAGAFGIDTGNRIGFFLGINYDAKIAESFAVRPGLQFAIKGSKFELASTSFSSNYNYLELPLDFVYISNNVSVHMGPYFGVLISAKSDGDDISDNIKSTDVGLNLGASYDLGLLGIGMNYGLGLSNINDESSDRDIRNKVISFFVTIGI